MLLTVICAQRKWQPPCQRRIDPAQMPVQHPQTPAKTEDTKQIEDLAMRYFLC